MIIETRNSQEKAFIQDLSVMGAANTEAASLGVGEHGEPALFKNHYKSRTVLTSSPTNLTQTNIPYTNFAVDTVQSDQRGYTNVVAHSPGLLGELPRIQSEVGLTVNVAIRVTGEIQLGQTENVVQGALFKIASSIYDGSTHLPIINQNLITDFTETFDNGLSPSTLIGFDIMAEVRHTYTSATNHYMYVFGNISGYTGSQISNTLATVTVDLI